MNSLVGFLKRERNSARLAFVLQLAARILNAAFALVWTPLLLAAMGAEVNGLWLVFLAVVSLGGLGDFGMGSAVGIHTTRLLADKKEDELQRFLASARALFLGLAVLSTLTLLSLSPWLPQWLGWRIIPEAGSLTLLLATAAFIFLPLILSNYIGNVSYACGNLTWPIIPGFVFGQAALAVQWLLARQQAPLWMQYIPSVATATLSLLLMWWFVRVSHPALARIGGLRFNWLQWRELGAHSFWLYFWSIGSVVYVAADRILIGKGGFGPEQVVVYHNNYKLCELAVFAIAAATFAAMPKIARWIASPDAIERERGTTELLRLNRVQIVLSCAAALAYLGLNDLFVGIWLGHVGDFGAPLEWQFAFALSLAITCSGDTATQTTPRCGQRGIRLGGMSVAVTAMINVVLSWFAMKAGYIAGIAFATVIAQSVFTIWTSRFVCAELKIPWGNWFARSWLLPVCVVSLAYIARRVLPFETWWQVTLLALIYLGLLTLVLAAVKIGPTFVRQELQVFRGIFRRS